MPNEWLPERDYHRDLSTKRLISLAEMFRTVWLRVSELHEPSAGDDMWSMSCRAFKRCAFQLNQPTWPWLHVIEQMKMQVVVCIGLIPVRFYHGSSEDVPTRYAYAPEAEVDARQLSIEFDEQIPEGLLLRIATTTDSKGVPQSVSLVAYDIESREIVNTFVIPEAQSGAMTVEQFPTTKPTPGIIQPKPSVRPKTGRVKDRDEQ